MPLIPATVELADVEGYGPYRVDLDLSHSLSNVWERPLFSADAARQLVRDHTAITGSTPPQFEQRLTWDGDDILVTTGARYGSADPGTERIRPDRAGRYALMPDWQWSLAAPDEEHDVTPI